jgi:hypothetical protein
MEKHTVQGRTSGALQNPACPLHGWGGREGLLSILPSLPFAKSSSLFPFLVHFDKGFSCAVLCYWHTQSYLSLRFNAKIKWVSPDYYLYFSPSTSLFTRILYLPSSSILLSLQIGDEFGCL